MQAIYEVREAAEEHARAEVRLEQEPTAEARDELIDSRIRLERSTHEAIISCHQCDRPHGPDQPCDVTRPQTPPQARNVPASDSSGAS